MKDGKPNVLGINRTKLFDPVPLLGTGWTVWCGVRDGYSRGLEGERNQDSYSLALSEIDYSMFRVIPCVITKAVRKSNAARLDLLISEKLVRPDAMIAQCLLEERDQATLKWILHNHSVPILEFMGTILRSPSGQPACLVISWDFENNWRMYHHVIAYDEFSSNFAQYLES